MTDEYVVGLLRRIVAEEDRGVIRQYMPPGFLRRLLAIVDAPPPPVVKITRKRGKK